MLCPALRLTGSLAVAAALTGCGAPAGQTGPPATRVKVEPVRQGPVSAEVPVVGTVVPSQVSRVASGAPGKVIEFPFREGQFVRQGDVLARLRSVTQEIELESARAVLAERQQQYALFEAGFRAEEIAQAKARMLAAEAMMHLAEANEQRRREANQRHQDIVTGEELDQAIFEAERARQAYDEARADHDLKAAGYRREEIEGALAAVKAQQQEIARIEDELLKRTIEAPFSGYLVEENTEIGEWIELGGVVATIARLDEVEVHVRVEEALIHEVQQGESVDVWVDAVGGGPLSGSVAYVVPRSQWQTGSRSFPVVLRMQNSMVDGQPLLKEGMVARITFQGAPREVLLAHKDAIVRSSGRPIVFVVGSDRLVRAEEIVEGLAAGEFIEVEGNLKPGDLLVTEGVERLRPYDEVAILDSPPAELASPQERSRPAAASGEPRSAAAASGGR